MTLQPIFDYKILFKSLIDRKSSGNRVLIKSGRLAFNYIISAIKEKTTINNINNTVFMSGMRPPIHFPRPELIMAFAIDRPPPNKIKIPQGSLVVILHSTSPEP